MYLTEPCESKSDTARYPRARTAEPTGLTAADEMSSPAFE
jgi:hypothetical protein